MSTTVRHAEPKNPVPVHVDSFHIQRSELPSILHNKASTNTKSGQNIPAAGLAQGNAR